MMEQIINLSNTLDYDQIISLCDNILNNIIPDDLIDSRLNCIKQTEFKDFMESNEELKLNYIEDWNNPQKYNLTLLFITLNYMDDDTLNNYIGNKSKKKYLNGEIIEDNTLSLIEFLDVDCNSDLYKNV